MRKFLALIAVAIVCFVFVACENSNNTTDNSAVVDEDNNAPDNDVTDSKPFIVKGMVAKGPLVKGSAIYFTILSETGEQEGLILNATTDDDMGRFSYKVTDVVAPNVVGKVCKISATGYFYDEIADRLSNAPITLEALFRITDTAVQDARINLLTHMTVKRTLQLMDSEMIFETAQAQAESELIDQMGVFYAPKGEDPKPAIQMDITADPYPLAVACIFNQAAFNTAKDDAEFYGKYQQLLNDTASDLTDGVLTDKIKEIIVAGEKNLDADACVANLKKYLEEKTGETKILPDPNESVDTNKDGVPNVSDPDIDGDGVPNEMDCVMGKTDYKFVSITRDLVCTTKLDNSSECFFSDTLNVKDTTYTASNDFTKKVNGRMHFCGIDTNQKLFCWGIFDGNTEVVNKKIPEEITTGTWKNVFAGQNRTCAIDASDQLYCWQDDLTVTGTKVNDDTDWFNLSLGNDQFYAIKTDNTLWSWNFGETPVQIGEDLWKEISNTSLYTVKADGTLWYISDFFTPLQVGSDTDWQSVYGTCAVKTDHTLWCWSDSDKTPATKTNPVGWSCGQWNSISHYKEEGYGELLCGIKSDNSLWCLKDGDLIHIENLPLE